MNPDTLPLRSHVNPAYVSGPVKYPLGHSVSALLCTNKILSVQDTGWVPWEGKQSDTDRWATKNEK